MAPADPSACGPHFAPPGLTVAWFQICPVGLLCFRVWVVCLSGGERSAGFAASMRWIRSFRDRTTLALQQAVPPAPAARAGDRPQPDGMSLLRQRTLVQAGRGCHRDAGGDSAPWKVIKHVREKFSCRDCSLTPCRLATTGTESRSVSRRDRNDLLFREPRLFILPPHGGQSLN